MSYACVHTYILEERIHSELKIEKQYICFFLLFLGFHSAQIFFSKKMLSLPFEEASQNCSPIFLFVFLPAVECKEKSFNVGEFSIVPKLL